MISVDEALSKIFALVTPLPVEKIPLEQAHRRVLRAPVRATRDQPPFSASSMDGYAVAGPARSGDVFKVIGEVAAGRAFGGSVGAGEAVRIFTGAPIPQGANQVLIQEDVTVSGNQIIVSERVETGTNIRPSGGDFLAGDQISAPRRLTAVDLALIAAMNCPQVVVTRRPEVAIIATGDELVMPGDVPRDDQIIASNAFAIKALVENEGARARILPIAADTETSLRATFDLARGADLIVTIGGASVGAYDLVGPVLQAMGGARAFYKIAMRPGKPLMAGTLGEAMVIGLPGNPVSSIVCTHLFIRPALRAMQGLGAWPLATKTAKLTQDLGPNGPRAHYMRATLGPDGTIAPLPRQDSSLLSVLAQADALLIQSPKCPGQPVGSDVRFVPFSDLDT